MVDMLISTDPSTGAEVWRGAMASVADCDDAMRTARNAFAQWASWEPAERIAVAHQFAATVTARRGELAAIISAEVGKPPWEAAAEADLVAAKVAISVDALETRRSTFRAGPAVTRFRPHGVCVVLGPYNYPAHLPNGHIVPAVIAGNCVVFKPSEHAPAVGAFMLRAWRDAGLPDGVLQVVQGDRRVAESLLDHPEVDGVFLTGSAQAGLAIHARFAGRPQVILALELGGNNPLVVHDVADPVAAAYLTTLSAYLTAGQRCTCARRLIVPHGADGDRFVEELVAMIGRIRVGAPSTVPEPFMGPVVSADAAVQILAAQAQLCADGARTIIESTQLEPDTGLLTPGLIDVTDVPVRRDEEIFGPLLQLIRTSDIDAAVDEATRTAFGLAAGLVSDNEALYRRFATQVRAGVVNWNQELVGASSKAPFGGIGLSGNHRPSAFFAADYCSFPVASIERPLATLPDNPRADLLPHPL